MQYTHTPVLLTAVLEWLAPKSGEHALDATLGGGGHAEKLLECITTGTNSANGNLVGCDRDPAAIAHAEPRLSARFGAQFQAVHAKFSELHTHASIAPRRPFDLVLADLGASSPQFDQGERGFSFTNPGPLDMRMDPTLGPTALDLLRVCPESQLERIFEEFGEERHSRRVAAALKATLAENPHSIKTTADLATAVAKAIPGRRDRHFHPATRVFQALRIAVNDELGELESLLERAPGWLSSGGRLGIISFHSLEDRRVKLAFRALASTGGFVEQTRKPIEATAEEIKANPRCRSAKLRVLRRV